MTPSVRCLPPSRQGNQNGREMSSRTVFVLSGDLILPLYTRKKRATPRFHDGMVSKTWLKQHHEMRKNRRFGDLNRTDLYWLRRCARSSPVGQSSNFCDSGSVFFLADFPYIWFLAKSIENGSY